MNAPDSTDYSPTPSERTAYVLDVMAELTGISTQTIVHYHKQGFISPVPGSEDENLTFDDDALRRLRRIEHLRSHGGMNDAGLQILLGLMDQVDELREALRNRR